MAVIRKRRLAQLQGSSKRKRNKGAARWDWKSLRDKIVEL